MTDQSPFSVGEPEWERGLWWMVIASGALHLLAIAALILIPHSFLHRPPPLVSYTVDLIAPDKLGGTNVVPGGKGQTNAPPIAVAKVEPPKPPPPKPEPPKPQEVKPPEPPKPPEVAKPEPPKPEPPKAEPPKVEAPPKPNEVALAEKPRTIVPPTAAKPPPSPQVKAPPSPPPKVVAKAEPAKPAPPPKASTKADTKAEKEAAAAQARDQQIAAAIRKVEQQVGAHGGGTGKETMAKAGGPISVGPGEGAGGAVRGVEYLLYYNQMINRIKQTWAWAGSNRSLEAAVHFSITETGDIVNVRIARPSGDASYDASVERAIKAATPLPPPPAAYSKEFSEVELTFRPEDLKM